MKILFIINKYTYTSIPLELAEELNKRNGVKVYVIAYYSTKKQVDDIKQVLGFNCKVIPINAKNSLDISGIKRLSLVLRELQPDIIHTHHTFSGAVARIVSKFIMKKNTRIIHTVHANHNSYGFWQNLIIGLTMPVADKIVCNSNNTLRSLKKWQDKILDANKKVVIYNGVRINKILSIERSIDIREMYNFNNNDFLIGTVGRLEEVKDHKTLINSFEIIKNSIPAAKLIIVGGGKLEKQLKSLVEEKNLTNEILITGTISREEVYKVLFSLDLFVITSKFEGFCNAMVEAMIAGNTIIASKIEPLPEVLGINNGLFFEVSNSNDLASKIKWVYQRSNESKQFANKAKSHALKNYSLETCVNRHKELYDEVYSLY